MNETISQLLDSEKKLQNTVKDTNQKLDEKVN